jgi:hypothetical protein
LSQIITFSRMVRNLLMTPTSVKEVAEIMDRHDHPVKPISAPTSDDSASIASAGVDHSHVCVCVRGVG